jgi:hypothetical protein
MNFNDYYLHKPKPFMRPLLAFIVLWLSMGHILAQNYVASNSEMSIYSSLSFGTSTSWATDRSATPGYFSWVNGSTAYSNSDDTHHVNGYVKKYGIDAFVFPVGSGTDLRTLTMSAPSATTDAYSTAWIVGNPSTTPDPTNSGGSHATTSFSAPVSAISPAGQWDWQAISGTGVGLTITVSIPDMTGFGIATDLRLVGWNGTAWVSLGTAGASATTENSTLSGTMIAGIQAIGIGKVGASLTFASIPPDQTATPSQAKTGTASTELVPTGGNGTYTYSVDNSASCTPLAGATPLPASSNLTVTNSTTGAYTYTAPATPGIYYFCMKVCDTASSTPECKTGTYKVVVSAPACAAGNVAPGVK